MPERIDREIADFLEGYKTISETAGYAVFIHDTKGQIFDVNKKAENLTGYSREELLKMNVTNLHPPRDRRLAGKKLRIIDKVKKRVEFTAGFLRKNREIVNVKIVADKFKFKKRYFVIGLVTRTTPYEGYDEIRKPDKGMPNRVKPLDKGYIESMRVLVDVAEARDPYTMKHSAKVTDYSVSLANYLGLPRIYVEDIKLAAMFHDVGKVGIRKEVLMKPTALDREEYEEVKNHPGLSVDMVRPIHFKNAILTIIRHHHENYDGTGYPDELKGEDIPLGARILSVADVYDALTSKRAYRGAYSHKTALEMMNRENGTRFDPVILKAFIACLSKRRRKKK